MKITILGAGSTVFTKRIVYDIFRTKSLCQCTLCLYDIDPLRLKQTEEIVKAINIKVNQSMSVVISYCGVEMRKLALKKANFVINVMQIGGYNPCTKIDFDIPKKYGVYQTIGDTVGIGGIMRGLRTIPVIEEIVKDMQEVCREAMLINYTNPMGIITGYIQRYLDFQCIGLCHSVQICTDRLLEDLCMGSKKEGKQEIIAGINHMAWLLEIKDKNGNDLYPEIRRKSKLINKLYKHHDMVRYEYIDKFGYYCTESSEHNAEYTSLFIKQSKPELLKKYNIPIDEYLVRCENQINKLNMSYYNLEEEYENGMKSREYVSDIMDSMVSQHNFSFNGNVINHNSIRNLPTDACVEIKCNLVNGRIVQEEIGLLPLQLAALNMLNINVQLMVIEAARSKRKSDIYMAAMLDPHTSAELSTDEIKSMCDELIDKHGDFMNMYL